MIDYDRFQEDLRDLKRARWMRILAGEPPGRAPGRRPRDPEQERILRAMDRARVEREHPELLRPRPR
jgi:hypothetical protein